MPTARASGTGTRPSQASRARSASCYYCGGENSAHGWGEYIWANPALGDSLQGLFSDGFIRAFIARDLAYDTSQWDVNQWLPQMSLVGSMYHAFNPDLSALKAHGAKMIIFNGATDTSVTPGSWRDRVVS